LECIFAVDAFGPHRREDELCAAHSPVRRMILGVLFVMHRVAASFMQPNRFHAGRRGPTTILMANAPIKPMPRGARMPAPANNDDLRRRMDFVGLDEATCKLLREIRPLIADAIGPALDAFYAKVQETPETARYFKDAKHISHAKGHQAAHWNVIAEAAYDDGYRDRVRAIGNTHARLGLEPRWYIGGYTHVLERLIHALLKDAAGQKTGFFQRPNDPRLLATKVSAVLKAAMLDMDLAISTYLEALETARQASENRQKTALTALISRLDRLSVGDLTTRLDCELADEFQDMRTKFNATIEQLHKTVSGVSEAADTIDRAVAEIAAASDDLSRRTESQAASLEQTTAAVTEITSTVAQTAEGAGQARRVVAAAKTDAEQGGEVARKAVGSMGGIEASSREVAKIIGVIDEIAFQTNLLALNAGVEAARAGDAGRGFAVVASEVRALAQRSTEAAQQIKTLIAESSEQVANGVQLVRETGDALDRIVASVSEINMVVANIATGAEQQAIGLREVSTAVSQMDQATQQNAAMVEETTAATRNLAQQSTDLARLVGGFKTSEADANSGLRGELQRVAPHVFASKPATGAKTQSRSQSTVTATLPPSRKPKAVAANAAGGHRGAGARAADDQGWEEV
jgi:methyl-accepting chemotaxis protein